MCQILEALLIYNPREKETYFILVNNVEHSQIKSIQYIISNSALTEVYNTCMHIYMESNGYKSGI